MYQKLHHNKYGFIIVMSYQLKFRLIVAAMMSLFMAAIMSGCIMATHYSPMEPAFFIAWRDAFLFAWPIAFPTAFLVSPIALAIAAKVLPTNKKR
jgi:uncharacterized membrane protein